ncbi:MAG: hypothetical protein JWM76_1328 [Pseudonocardiales bacterium]|nr:hypothetical protein [Pseudonocardiales bacterium]
MHGGLRDASKGKHMNIDVELPEFTLDCRDWLVATEADGVFEDEICDGPVLAILSTVVIEGGRFHAATTVISLALLGDEVRFDTGLNPAGFNADRQLGDADWETGHARYVAPAPNGDLALVAEFSSESDPPLELTARFHELLASFSWIS